MGGDFNAQLSHLDTNGSTVNRWHWLTSLAQEKKAAADTFRTVHRERLDFTRYKNSLLPCDTRIDLLLFSSSVVSLPSASLLEADIESADTSSDHHPIYCTLRLPCTPQYPPPPAPTTRFRRLTPEEQKQFHASLQPLEVWAVGYRPTAVPQEDLVSHVNSLVDQVAQAYHSVTRPPTKHSETKIERDFQRALSNLPQHAQRRKEALKNLQQLSEKWRKKQSAREKKRLHYSMVRGSKNKKTIDSVLNHKQHTPVHLWDPSTNPPDLVCEPEKVGTAFSECLSNLGGDPDFRVPDRVLQPFISLLPQCPPGTADQPLPLPGLPWLHEITGRASPSKSTGEDEINYYVISLCPPGSQLILLEAIRHVLLYALPPKWARARDYR